MPKGKKSISGKVIEQATKKGIPNIVVQVWDKKKRSANPILETTTKRGGKFTFKIVDKNIEKYFASSSTLYFRLLRGEHEIYSTIDNLVSGQDALAQEQVFELALKEKSTKDQKSRRQDKDDDAGDERKGPRKRKSDHGRHGRRDDDDDDHDHGDDDDEDKELYQLRKINKTLHSVDGELSVHTGIFEKIEENQNRHEQRLQNISDNTTDIASLTETTNSLLQTLNENLDDGTTPQPDLPLEYVVHGRVASRELRGVAGMRVVVLDKDVGGDTTLGEATTGEQGEYEVHFSRENFPEGKREPDLQVMVYSGEDLLTTSDVRFDASSDETINLVLDEETSTNLRSEYETLATAIALYYKDNPADLQENDERQDITYLSNKTGWDARAVALFALAAQFSDRSKSDEAQGIEPAFFYALFRAGLPTNDTDLYRTDYKTVESIWNKAITQSIIPDSLQERIPESVLQFQQLASQQRLEGPAAGGTSNLKELLTDALGDDSQKQKQFADLYTQKREEPDELWDAVREDFGQDTANRLKLDGQLAYLTLNNATLNSKLHAAAGDAGLNDTSDLINAGYYRADTWHQTVGDDSIPPEITGATDEERREQYTELLAAQMRLSFPTQVAAQMVNNNETPVDSEGVRDEVYNFLSEHKEQFQIAQQPINQYLARNNLQLNSEARNTIARIQRVQQVTPDDQSMNALLQHEVDSAFAVTRYDRNEFVQAFKNIVGGEKNAIQIHAKSQQVHSATLNVALSYLAAKSAPAIGVHSPGSIVDPAPSTPDNVSDVLAYSTLENLFGEMDYCACEHCRSILSPAAYLVDLLLFIDRPESEIPEGFTNPLTVLMDRRPDIENLPLTCENTNAALPYIDLVNETLEFYITHGLSLNNYPGHNTDGSVNPEDLLTSPQFVSETAYQLLYDEYFPYPLPFHLPLENLRRYFNRFDAPLFEVMEALRKNDDLERSNSADYGWRDIWMEVLGLSRTEHRLLTRGWSDEFDEGINVALTIKRLYGFDDEVSYDYDDYYDDDESIAEILAVLKNAKSYSSRVGITYEQLTKIIKAQFINPNSHLILKLERLGVSFAVLKEFKDGNITDEQFDAMVSPGVDPAPYGGDIKAWVTNDDNYSNIMSLITLSNPYDPENVCSFDSLELRYSNPDSDNNDLQAFEFVRLIRFIRLWKKLGWSIEHTDKAMTALYPEEFFPNSNSDSENISRLDSGFLVMLPKLAIIMRVMELLKLKPEKDLLPLLSCWSEIDTQGEFSLYRQMFLSPTQLDDDFADDGYGNYMIDPDKNVLDHVETLRAAFSLNASEFDDIINSLGYDEDTALNLQNISAIFRRGWLARQLKLSVREFLLISEFMGYSVFESLDATAPGILHIINFIDRLRTLRVKPTQMLYLIWNQDLSGESAPTESEITDFASNVRSALTAIEQEYALVDDPNGSIARDRMALVYGNDAADFFFGLLDYTFISTVTYSHDQVALEQAIIDVAPGRILYDDLSKRLSFTGVFDVSTRDALKAVGGVSQSFQDAIDALFAANQNAVDPFFLRYPELLPLHDTYVNSADPEDTKRSTLLAAILPELKRGRKRQQALQSVTAAVNTTMEMSIALLENSDVMHAVGDAARPALDDLTAVVQPGFSAQFFDAATITGAPSSVSNAEAYLDYISGGANSLPDNSADPGASISGMWSGYLEAPENGFYKLQIDTDATATVAIVLHGEAIALTQSGNTWNNTDPIELRAGTLYAFELRVENVIDNLAVRWQTAGRGWEVIPAPYLYSSNFVENLKQVYVRFLKSVALADRLKLSAAEMAFIATHPDYQDSGESWINRLPIMGDPEGDTITLLRSVQDGLLDYARIKSKLAPDDERLLQVLRDPNSAMSEPDSLLYVLTHWEKDSVDALLDRFEKVPSDLSRLDTLRRVYEAYAWVKMLGVSANELIDATTNEPSAAVVTNLQAALHARYDTNSWSEVLRPINDEMRALQRDALVSYILYKMRSNPASAHIDTADKLFEYFLMDVQMQPCMLTSRIRNALSSVQLFIERCLMNLEPRVSPKSIKAKQWEWMKRYRVWEANRKVFLYPENWLEPELRDDQSPFFKETMSELLQGDITEDRAAQAFVNYLTKLEEVSKLEICGVHYEENDPGTSDDIAHVIARTAGANRKYFYRRRESSSWTPWEKITLDIEDNPVLPVVWNNRLFLFWLRIIKEPLEGTPSASSSTKLTDVTIGGVVPDLPKLRIKAILSWSEFLDGKWQPARSSDPEKPLGLGVYHLSGSASFDRTKLRLSTQFWSNGALRLIVSNQVGSGASFYLYNNFSTPELRPALKYPHFSPKRTLDTATSSLEVKYSSTTQTVLSNSITDKAIDPHHPLQSNSWDIPFFYEDNRHVFYVTTEERLVAAPQWSGFGVFVGTQGRASPEIAGVVYRRDSAMELQPDVPVTRQPGFGVVDPSPLDYYVTEDVYISTAIGSPGTVRFGDREIGPSGSQFRNTRAR